MNENKEIIINIKISKRLYIACAAMQGMLYQNNIYDSDIPERAFKLADQLLKQEIIDNEDI